MTVSTLLAALRATDAVLYVDQTGTLRYAGPKLPADSAIRVAIAAHRTVLIELFTYSPGGRCQSAGCYRLPDHEGEHLALEAVHSGTTEVAA